MRDPNRLYKFYNHFALLHATAFPDLREGQVWFSFFRWCEKKNIDPFYIESEELLVLFTEFAGL